VADVRKREATRSPAPPFITSTLQQEAGRRLGFTAKRTMTVAQQLYEGLEVPGEGHVGLITYMRTDSTQIAQEAVDEVRGLIGERFGTEFVPEQPRAYKTKAKGAQEAHEAIRPTSSVRTPESLRGHIPSDLYRLYTLIWKRFVASQMENAVFDTTAVDVRATAGQETYLLRANGSIMRFAGFLKVMGEAADGEEDEEARKKVLPELSTGEPVDMETVTPEQHFTQPPPRYTEATLIRALEEEGIGRPSTYAPILSTIQDRGYVQKVEKALRPTEIGTIVNDLLVEHFPDVVDPGFTAQIEEDLDEVAEGDKDWVPVVQEFFDPFSKTLEKAASMMERVKIADEPSDEICECTGNCSPEGTCEVDPVTGVCGKPMVIKLGRFGKFLACSGFPECRNTRTLLAKIGVDCPQCGGDIIERKTKKGRTFYGCSNYPACNFMTWQRPVAQRCPVEGGLQTIQSGGRIVCTVCGRVSEPNEAGEPAPAATPEREREPVTV
jgi:DNA topoisomerase-1